jgi:hypothetical protein
VDVDDLAVAHHGRRDLRDGRAVDRGGTGACLHRRHETGLDVEANRSFPWPASHGHDPLIGSGAFQVEDVQA